ncbi:hypothetical protein [Methylopila sp. Yamaguchi]|jgi:hypothetical protein|uniref:hypothetical protein n=1 Tax=Methylopila sp. Yamaguchi TaxID=1437817 RepID=UPI000CAF1920|nr:hypothetical protein [Methylopila sp. Yamaguchi]GBD50299.1 hypothetical protein METY_3512 [Methylopila sp. Yamaguchi]
MNSKVLFLLIGLAVGGLAGWLTRPQAAEVSFLGLKVEVQGDQAAAPGDKTLTTGQAQHVGVCALIGALLGFGVGFMADRRRG